MAVKTKITKKIFQDLLKNYDLGSYINSKPVKEGTVQTNYFLQTTKEKLIFRYYENRSMGSVKFESHLVKYLKNNKYPCPDVYLDKKGKLAGLYKQKPYVLFEFVEGEHLENPTEVQESQLIKKVAELQKLTRNYRSPYEGDRWNYTKELCLELAKKETKKLKTANSRKKFIWLEKELARVNLPDTLPKGICHCDFHFSNILFRDGQFKALIDFDDANYTYLIYDLATLVNPFKVGFDWNTWLSYGKEENIFDFSDARKIVNKYLKCRSLSDDEKMYLYDVFKLSILFDCIWYFSRGKADDFYEKRKISYLNNLGRDEFYHRLFVSNLS